MIGDIGHVGHVLDWKKKKPGPRELFDRYTAEGTSLQKSLDRSDPNGSRPHYPLPSLRKQLRRRQRLNEVKRLINQVVNLISH